MLYERWREIALERRLDCALRDLESGRRWTFGELFEAGQKAQVGPAPIVFPQGQTPEFILSILGAWREGKVVCPIEPGAAKPQIDSVPAGCVHLKTTSATSGTAQLVAFKAEQLMADPRNLVATMGLRADWANLGVISLAHSYGFSNLVLPLLLHGIPLILAPSPLPEIVLGALLGESAVTLPGVPALWWAWHQTGAITPAVKLAISAGAPLPLPMEQEVFARRGLKIHNFYGSTECGGIAYDATEVPRCDPACVGSAVKNVDIRINSEGCLEVRGDAVGQTYWPQTNEKLQSGRFQTTDLAEICDGSVVLRGRIGDLINVAGRKVSPELIERVLTAHRDVRECLVLGAPDAAGERTDCVVAIVVAQRGITTHELTQFLLLSLPAWQIPKKWWFVDAIGANNRGKISRAQWRQRYLETQADS